MKKKILLGVALLLIIALFNAVSFICIKHRGSNYWCGYAFITLAWMSVVASTVITSKDDQGGKGVFLNSPAMLVTVVYFCVEVVFGIFVMIIPTGSIKPVLIVQLVFFAAFAVFYLILTIQKIRVQDIESDVDSKEKFASQFCTNLAHIMNCCTPQQRILIEPLFEAAQYADATSENESISIESEIEGVLPALRSAIEIGDDLVIQKNVDMLTKMIKNRDILCASARK